MAEDTKKVTLFGAQADELKSEVSKHPGLTVVDADPDAIVCYGGDGTLLTAELRWPGIPKAPIRNSKRGHRCIAHPAAEVLERLASGGLVPSAYMKLECALTQGGNGDLLCSLSAMNEFNVHMGRINSAVRFKLFFNGEPYEDGIEIVGDGFVISTPFGSTAYFNQITRGVFHAGIGIALKSTAHYTSHMILPEDVEVRALITRGPAVLAFDNSQDYFTLEEGDELLVRKHDHSATILTWDPMPYQTDEF